jgi:predicted nucleotidyltransferase
MAETPTPSDLQTARTMAERIVAAGEGGVERVILFGSRARGSAHPRSDFDRLVVETRRRPAYPEEERRTDALPELGIWADIRVVSLSSFERTRSVVAYLTNAAATEGLTLFVRDGDERARSAVA